MISAKPQENKNGNINTTTLASNSTLIPSEGSNRENNSPV